jgi:hypothetical protein
MIDPLSLKPGNGDITEGIQAFNHSLIWKDMINFRSMLPKKQTESSGVGVNNFDEMLHAVSECVELCRLEGPVATTVTGDVLSDYCVHVHCQGNNQRYATVLITVCLRCNQRKLFMHLYDQLFLCQV